jgi:steroid delta-isomerase-like uncharacterized protein
MLEPMDPNSLLIRLFDEAVNQGHVEVISELYSPKFTDHSPGPGQQPGPDGIIDAVKRYRIAIPDLEVKVEDVVVSGDRMVTRETWSGTHMEEIAGVPATRKQFTATRMHIFRIEDGLITEEWTAGSIIDVLRNAVS